MVARGRPNADAFDAAVAAEAAEALARDDGSLYHDYLAENYEPAYFHQFIAHAERHGHHHQGADQRDPAQEQRRQVRGEVSVRCRHEM